MALALARTRRISLTGWLRATIRIACMALLLIACVPLYYLHRLFSHHNPWPRVFLAGVAALQELDYADAEDCRRAANVTALLARMTALQGLAIEASGCEPTRSDTCRYQAYAAAWARLCADFAANDRDGRAWLQRQGRPTGL